jgi:anti-sigma-K factor RskA
MKHKQKYIESGMIELYVFGAFSTKKSQEASSYVVSHPELIKEVDRIEKALLELSISLAPREPISFNDFKNYMQLKEDKVIMLSQKRTNLSQYLGWVAYLLMIVAVAYLYIQNKKLTHIRRMHLL